jgi:hypothetical protein
MWKNNVYKFVSQAGSGFGHFSPFFKKKQEKTFAFLIYTSKCLILLHFSLLAG